MSKLWIVEWQHNDAPGTLADGTVQTREDQIISRNRKEDNTFLFESPVMKFDDVYRIYFNELPEGLDRYNTFLGLQRIPSLVDTRPVR